MKELLTRKKTLFVKRMKILWQEERGDFMGSIGWMAILATVLVVTHGLLTGWLPGFIDRVFSQLNTLV